jgi:Zn-dependent protease
LNQAQFLIILIPIVLFSLTVHEYSHGRMAFLLGDNTAKKLGRLTFNPFKHLDLMGTVSFYFLGFGWAKPVPVNPRNFENPHRDMMFVALAGPASNLVLAFVLGFSIRIIPLENFSPILLFILSLGLYINIALAIFNMLPVFPLDGASVLKGLVSPQVAARLSYFDKYTGILLLGVFLMDYFAETGIIISIIKIPITFMLEFFSQDMYPVVKMMLPFI